MSKQTHLISRTLKSNDDVHAFFSIAPTRKAILFIHGYCGSALATWSDFPSLLPQHPKFAGHDLYFYGYDGLRSPVGSSAALFLQFLVPMFADTAGMVNANLSPVFRRTPNFGYDELIIVAHSLGAVIARRTLLDATGEKMDWVSRTKLVLYAPAHKGAKVAELVLQSVTTLPFMKWFSGAAKFASPLLDELNPAGSQVLASLLQETIDLCANGQNPHLIARKVVWAHTENIVTNTRFGSDPIAHAIKGTSHMSVCKPKSGLNEAFACLEECL